MNLIIGVVVIGIIIAGIAFFMASKSDSKNTTKEELQSTAKRESQSRTQEELQSTAKRESQSRIQGRIARYYAKRVTEYFDKRRGICRYAGSETKRAVISLYDSGAAEFGLCL